MAAPEPDIFVLADRELLRVLESIAPEQWSMTLPSWFHRPAKQADFTVRELVNYHAYDDAWVPAMLAGKTMEQAGADSYDGDLVGDDPAASYRRLSDAAVAAAQAVNDLNATVHCSFGDFTVQEYFWQINMFRTLRARDFARLIGADERLPEVLVEGVYEEISPQAEFWRGIGVFREKLEVPDSAALQDKLFALTGGPI